MKKIIFGIFAHPDDEAFGPSGTLLMEKAAGNEVHLICATAGEHGVNPDNVDNLAETRLEEWHAAGKLIGADAMHHLGYMDSHLCNEMYHEVADSIKTIVRNAADGRDDIEIELLSLDSNGLTGHLDHIFMSRVAHYVFYTLKETDPRITRLRLFCMALDDNPAPNCDWLYMDAGRNPEEISETIDAREHVEKVYEIMRAHHTQRADGETHIKKHGEDVAVNHFLELR